MYSRLEPEISRDDPVFDRLIEALNSDQRVVYAKINHGFWERCVALEKAGFDLHERDADRLREMDEILVLNRPAPFMFEGGFVEDLFSCFQAIPHDDKNYIFSASLLAIPKRHEIAGSIENIGLCEDLMKRLVPKKLRAAKADGMELKKAIITGGYIKFAEALRSQNCLLIGNAEIETYFDFMGVKQGEFIEIHPTHAREEKDGLLAKIQSRLTRNKPIDTVLLQAGGALSSWLSYQLHEDWPDVSFIDIGRGALICNPEKMFKTPFGKIYKNQITQSIEQIKPEWLKTYAPPPLRFNLKTGRTLSRIKGSSSDATLDEIRHHDPKIDIQTPIDMNLKPPRDEGRIRQIGSSVSDPVALAQDTLTALLNLPNGQQLILCSSKENALKTAEAILRGAGYNASGNVIEHPNALDVDVDSGVWSQCHSYPMWNKFRHILRRENSKKSLIIDNQNGLFLRPTSPRPRNEVEVLACNEETPWGIHQVSALILADDFGVEVGSEGLALASVSKHEACALIETIERYDGWLFFYQKQMKRIFDYVSRHFPHLDYESEKLRLMSPVGKLTYKSSRPIKPNAWETLPFEVKIYTAEYRSGDPASSLIDIPCHPYMRHISEGEFVESLARLF